MVLLREEDELLGAQAVVVDEALEPLRSAEVPVLGLTQLSNYLALKGSFSAVSKPNFASKYALELGSV